ncbi:hypothetical protein [Sagittula sp. SSi028]|uniref:hypothetical protein n=1 Tax=Sagittula sp. SSi028 TaxID=3400636 RepID=UPI003AF6E76B
MGRVTKPYLSDGEICFENNAAETLCKVEIAFFRQEGLPPNDRVALTAPEAAVRTTRSERLDGAQTYHVTLSRRMSASKTTEEMAHPKTCKADILETTRDSEESFKSKELK